MRYIPFILLLLVLACSKPTTESTPEADSLNRDTVSATNAPEATSPQTTDNEARESKKQESEVTGNDDLKMIYGGEYTLDSSSEAEYGSSLTLTHKSGSTFTISITKMVADFCSGTIEAEISFDKNNSATFEADGHPVTVKLVNKTVVVEDPERQLGVGTCDYNGTFLSITDGIN